MLRLLIADDEIIERKMLYKTLQKNIGDRCAVFQAENGRKALEIYEEEKIQIVILDIEMPGMNGIEAAQHIRRKDKECCIIFLTAYDEFNYAKKAIAVQALDYLLKPYNEQELMLVVEEAIRLSSGRRENIGDGEALFLKAQPPHKEPEDCGKVSRPGAAHIMSRYIEDNYMHDISMQDLARHMNYSEAYFCKLFKQYFHKNFTFYLTEYRVKEAKRMLAQPTVNVKDIGKAVGYGDSNYFAKVFKRITGQSPTEYRLYIFQNT